MPKHLYLDTARLGQMSVTASKMYTDFGRLAAEVPSGPCTEKFLFHGHAAAPEIAQRFPELRRWQGINRLKERLRAAFARHSDSNTEVLLANRTTELMERGVQSLFGSCRRVLLTDFTWPPYLLWMLEYFGCHGIDVSMLPLKHAVWKEQCSAGNIASMIVSRVQDDACDGVFLPAITHTGVRLPIADVLETLGAGPSSPVTLIDASQAYGHIDTNKWVHLADYTFGGMHKWVRAYLPLAVGFSKPGDGTSKMLGNEIIQPGERNETVNFAPFMTACGALSDLQHRQDDPFPEPAKSISARLLKSQNWEPLHTASTLHSRIQLIRPRHRTSQSATRQKLTDAYITATVFSDSTVRISSPMDNVEKNGNAHNAP